MTEDEPPRSTMPLHAIGQPLDTLSLHEFEERIALLREEIARLEVARDRKRTALDAASSAFGPRR